MSGVLLFFSSCKSFQHKCKSHKANILWHTSPAKIWKCRCRATWELYCCASCWGYWCSPHSLARAPLPMVWEVQPSRGAQLLAGRWQGQLPWPPAVGHRCVSTSVLSRCWIFPVWGNFLMAEKSFSQPILLGRTHYFLWDDSKMTDFLNFN